MCSDSIIWSPIRFIHYNYDLIGLSFPNCYCFECRTNEVTLRVMCAISMQHTLSRCNLAIKILSINIVLCLNTGKCLCSLTIAQFSFVLFMCEFFYVFTNLNSYLCIIYDKCRVKCRIIFLNFVSKSHSFFLLPCYYVFLDLDPRLRNTYTHCGYS